MTIQTDYTLDEVASALGMSTRWVRQRIREGAEHQRYGHKIRFTPEQVDRLKSQFTANQTPQSITTGRKKKSA